MLEIIKFNNSSATVLIYLSPVTCCSAENNNCIARIIPVTCKCTGSSVSAYHSAKTLKPHSTCLMMLPGSWSFTEGSCPLGPIAVTYSTCDVNVSGRGDTDPNTLPITISPACFHSAARLSRELQNQLSQSRNATGSSTHWRVFAVCVYVCVCVQQHSCV